MTIRQGSTIGIVGNGQLGKMLAQAAATLGYKTAVYGEPGGCAFDCASRKITGDYHDGRGVETFIKSCDVGVLEFENIGLDTFDSEEVRRKLCPGREALRVSQDRREEKAMARSLGIKVPRYWVIETQEDLDEVDWFPVILKTARNGYDGKGQVRVGNSEDLLKAWNSFDQQACVVERVVSFWVELSTIVARWRNGNTVGYSAFRNVHRSGILAETQWPFAEITSEVQEYVEGATEAIAKNLDIVGLLAVEWFLTHDGEILFNEIAPRPHNSGHITLDCAHTSQFEQCIRAICDLPPGSSGMRMPGRMTNVIGDPSEFWQALTDPGARVYNYGKNPRPGRKLGHINYCL